METNNNNSSSSNNDNIVANEKKKLLKNQKITLIKILQMKLKISIPIQVFHQNQRMI